MSATVMAQPPPQRHAATTTATQPAAPPLRHVATAVVQRGDGRVLLVQRSDKVGTYK